MSRSQGRLAVILAVVLAWPLIPGVPSDLFPVGVTACEYAIPALSLVLLIGMVGQISLCQAALVGVGAFVGAIATLHMDVHFPFTLIVGMTAGAGIAAALGLVALRVRGLYLAVATLIFAYLCQQYLFAQTWLVQSRSGASIPFESIGRPGTLPYFDLGDAKTFYYAALAVAAVAVYGVSNIRESRVGRAFSAVRGSEIAAASLGINVTRYKLLGFACSGALAGLGGALILVGERNVVPDQFNFVESLFFLSIAVVGGLRSIGGAIAASVLFAVLEKEVFFRYPATAEYRDLIPALLLIAVLLFFRGGLGAVPEQAAILRRRMEPHLARLRARLARPRRDDQQRQEPVEKRSPGIVRRVAGGVGASSRRVASLRARRRSRHAAEGAAAVAATPVDIIGVADRLVPRPLVEPVLSIVDGAARDTIERAGDVAADSADVPDSTPQLAAFAGGDVAGEAGADGRRLPVLLSATDITVRFGGLTAVDNVSLQVGAGEIVGLIGPNGAGKTTMFNALLGLNSPTAGHVELYGRDVSSWPVHRRAALGVGRTFQILQLFGDLTVFENLMIATHLQSTTGLFGALAVTPGARRSDFEAAERVEAALRLMELEDLADRRVAGLPFGALRLIEVARTLVTGARLVCFDEPASGLDSAETERLIEWFRFLRQIGITLLVIEHDVSMVTRLCDYIYVLDQGRLLAHGRPAEIQRHPAVIASYLGTGADVA